MGVEIGPLLENATEAVDKLARGDGNRNVLHYLQLAKVFFGQGFERLDLTPDVEGRMIKDLERWYADDPDGKKQKLLGDVLDIALKIFPEAEKNGAGEPHLFGIVGHDSENAANMAGAALLMIDKANERMGPYATWELLTCAAVENLGRLYQGNDFTHQASGLLLAREITRHITRHIDASGLEGSAELQHIYRRVMSRIYGHGTKNSGDPNMDLVAQINRWQNAGGSEWSFRTFPYDAGIIGQEVFTDIDEVRRSDMSHTFVIDGGGRVPPTVMDWGEFLVRNLFPFYQEVNAENPRFYQEIMKSNQADANKRRADGVAILTILAGGEGTALFEQVFATDLGLVEQYHWSKKPIDKAIFEEGLERYKEFRANPPEFPELNGLSQQAQIEAILWVGNSVLPAAVLERVFERAAEGKNRERLTDALKFALGIYYQDLEVEMERLDKQVLSGNPFVTKVAEFRRVLLSGKKRLDLQS